MSIKIFDQEIKDGLADRMKNNSIAHLSQVKLSINPNQELKELSLNMVKATNMGQIDLYYLSTILVTTGCNDNDDFFSPEEVWAARHTPEDKPFNYEHSSDDIIGHITGSYAIDEKNVQIPDDTTIDNLPAKFHILTSAVIYKFSDIEERQKRIDKVIAEINEGKWFVSMEALFKGFDYSLIGEDGMYKVVARNDQTAFLTKHLRVYGGSGKYQNYKVGRVLKNIVFSGKGLVKEPANPESIILNNSNNLKSVGYKSDSTIQTENKNTMEKELENAKARIAELEKAIRDNDVKGITDEKDKAVAKVAALEAELKKVSDGNKLVTDELANAQKEVCTVKASLTEKEAELKVAKDELAKINTAKVKAERINKVKNDLKLSDEKAEKLVTANAHLNDEQFNASIEAIVDVAVAKVEKTEKSPEKDKVGEKTVAKTSLEDVVPEKDADLSVSESDEDFATVQADINKWLNQDTEE